MRSKLDPGFIISLPLECGSAQPPVMSVENFFSANAEVEVVDATCTKCGCPEADSRRSYVAVGSHMIIQLKRYRWDKDWKKNFKVSSTLPASSGLPLTSCPGIDMRLPFARSEDSATPAPCAQLGAVGLAAAGLRWKRRRLPGCGGWWLARSFAVECPCAAAAARRWRWCLQQQQRRTFLLLTGCQHHAHRPHPQPRPLLR